jgi:hypothetical protein
MTSLMWAGSDERDGLLTGESRWRVDRDANQIMVCRDWYEEGCLVSPQHIEYTVGVHRPLVWRNHKEGASDLPYVSIFDFAAALVAEEI